MSDRTTGPLPPRCPECSKINGHLMTCSKRPGAALETLQALAKPALRAKNSAERKAEPLYDGLLKYFPDALAAVSRVSKKGNDKHNPGEPLHWARGKSTDQMNCVIRHSLTPVVSDVDTGEPELAHAAWRLLAELQLVEEQRLKGLGIMPYSGIVP